RQQVRGGRAQRLCARRAVLRRLSADSVQRQPHPHVGSGAPRLSPATGPRGVHHAAHEPVHVPQHSARGPLLRDGVYGPRRRHHLLPRRRRHADLGQRRPHRARMGSRHRRAPPVHRRHLGHAPRATSDPHGRAAAGHGARRRGLYRRAAVLPVRAGHRHRRRCVASVGSAHRPGPPPAAGPHTANHVAAVRRPVRGLGVAGRLRHAVGPAHRPRHAAPEVCCPGYQRAAGSPALRRICGLRRAVLGGCQRQCAAPLPCQLHAA
ncbi:hypothetical protein EV174_006855, partial [Coemansia sp. RSA 2320]